MPFEKIEKWAGIGNGVRASGVRAYTISPARGQHHAQIALGKDVQAATGLTSGAHYDALLGNGAESGFLAIQKSKSLSARKLSNGGAGPRSMIRISVAILGIREAFEPCDLPYRIKNDQLIVDLRQLLPAKQARAKTA